MKRAACVFILLVLFVVSWAVAQESKLGLSDADFQLFSSANSTAISSFAFDYTAHTVVEGLDTFAVNADLSGSGAMDAESHSLDLSLNGNILLGTAQTITPQAEMRWIDGKLYFNPGDGWQERDDAPQFASDLIYQIGTLSADPDQLAEWNLSSIDGMDSVMAALKELPLTNFLSVERLDDETVGDAKTAHFQVKADLHGLMDSDEFVSVIKAFSEAQGSALAIIYDDTQLADIVRANNALFEKMTVTVDQYIGLDDQLIHRVALNLSLPLEPAKLNYVDAPFTFSADLDMTLSGLNQPQDIPAPDEAKTADAFTLLPEPPLEPAGDGVTQYIFFETVGENEAYTHDFEAQAGDKVTISVRGLGFDFDTNTSLLSADGQTLAENEDREAEVFGMGPYDSQIVDFPIAESGTYRAEVTEYDGAAGSFVVTVTIKR